MKKAPPHWPIHHMHAVFDLFKFFRSVEHVDSSDIFETMRHRLIDKIP